MYISLSRIIKFTLPVIWQLNFNAILYGQQLNIILVDSTITNVQEVYTVKETDSSENFIYNVVKTNDKILFCNKNFLVLDEKTIEPDSRTKIFCSKLHKYFLLKENLYLAEDKFSTGQKQITLIDYKNNQYFSKIEYLEYDYYETRKTVISDFNGNVYELETSTAEFIIKSRFGVELKRINLYDNFEYYYTGLPGYIDISADGNTVAIIMNRTQHIHERMTGQRKALRGKDKDKIIRSKYIQGQNGEPNLFVFNKEGVKLLQKQLPGETSMGVSVTNNAEYIFASTNTFHPQKNIRKSNTVIFNIEGNTIHNFPFVFSNFDLANNLLVVACRCKERYLSAINLNNGEIEWKMKLGKNITSVDITEYGWINVISDDGLLRPPSNTEYQLLNININDGKILQSLPLGKFIHSVPNIKKSYYLAQEKEKHIYKIVIIE